MNDFSLQTKLNTLLSSEKQDGYPECPRLTVHARRYQLTTGISRPCLHPALRGSLRSLDPHRRTQTNVSVTPVKQAV